MELSQQVVSLDLAKRLEKLGVKQESLFKWCERVQFDSEGPIAGGWQIIPTANIPTDESDIQQAISAFTVAELGKMLPVQVEGRFFQYDKSDLTHRISYYNQDLFYLQEADTEANVRAKMLCYLLQNNLIPHA